MAERTGEYMADSLQTEGFIHLSTEDQVLNVANSFYKDFEDLVLLYVDAEIVKQDLRWEGKDEHGEDFPHLYSSLQLNAVVRVEDFVRNRTGNYVMPG